MINAPLRPWSCAPARPASCGSCASQFSVWQWRQMSSFSRMKKPKIPPRMPPAAARVSPFENASGMTLRNAAPSSAPMAYETSVDTQEARRASEKAARPADSVPPTKLATRIQPRVMGAAILREPDGGRHARCRAVAAIGKEAFGVGIGAQAATIDTAHASTLEALPRDRVQVEQPVARTCRDEGCLVSGKGGAHLFAHFVHLRSDRGPQPAKYSRRVDFRCVDGCFDDAGGEAADRKSTRLNSSHDQSSYAVFCLKKKKKKKKIYIHKKKKKNKKQKINNKQKK